jgi:hypothetical protein
VKRLCADDSAATSVKVGYRQASYMQKPVQLILSGLFAFQLSTMDIKFSLANENFRIVIEKTAALIRY